MSEKSKVLLLMSRVTGMRSERTRDELAGTLRALRAIDGKIAVLRQRLGKLVAMQRNWMRAVPENAGRLAGTSDEMRMPLKWIEQQIFETLDAERELERGKTALIEARNAQKRAMLKHDELGNVYRMRRAALGKWREAAAEEDHEDAIARRGC
ncbi:hypothetical protein BTI_4151 [Burkholderia thailandensis MSMB121]|uniref:hypothetical protein n=1 Tax=Burkholderia humptydooensis TaxID=430531 RepID=UPI000327F6FA|nr:hypothetical protein [Burkholderia humptydooensis]AGK50087.1 hypothetical protein BTI_4151 [Burkholderia thailandensis MSMB121]ATF32287.1 hypothetical protein CO709_01850 [Burkholderia thailandensis]KST72352.1 hypothetical protein WS76_28175 [Burkholderia humptydooensis]